MIQENRFSPGKEAGFLFLIEFSIGFLTGKEPLMSLHTIRIRHCKD